MTKDNSSHQITEDDLYRHSSQYRLWNFTKQELYARKEAVHLRATDKMRSSFEKQNIIDIELMTMEDHDQLVNFYASKIEEIAKVFFMPSQVWTCAVTYFKRFYLQNSIMEYHPKNIMYTTVFLASKSENFFIPIEKFCKALPRVVKNDILELEFLVVQSLNFTLLVHNPLKALHGFYLDIQSTLQDVSHSLGKFYDISRSFIMKSLISDALLLYTPPQMALAAMNKTDPALTSRYLKTKWLQLSDNHNKEFPDLDRMVEILENCANEMKRVMIPTPDIGKKIDKKLYICMNPHKKKRQSPPTDSDNQQIKKAKT